MYAEVKVSKNLHNGYQWFYDINHPLAGSNGKVYYHRHVASLKIGRWLNSYEHVHHLDNCRENNSEDNIEVLSNSEHYKLHHGERKTYICKNCGKENHNKNYCGKDCQYIGSRIVERPSKEELIELIKKNSWKELGQMYDLSDNAIRKWAKAYDIL